MFESKRKFHVIYATSKNHGIGLNNKIPWPNIPADMTHFRKITTNYRKHGQQPSHGINVVIMGRKTFESIPNKSFPLQDRFNVIITKEKKEEILKLITENKWHNVIQGESLVQALCYLDNV